jgi:carboxylesterase type B
MEAKMTIGAYLVISCLLDMIAGLQWVQKNITAFGGKPDKVVSRRAW